MSEPEESPAVPGADDGRAAFAGPEGLAAAFGEALRAAVEGTGLGSRFLDGSEAGPMPWLQRPGAGGGYWIGCGLSEDPARRFASWPTFLWALYVHEEDGGPDGEVPGARPLDLVLTGAGARDPAVLAAITVTAVQAHIGRGCPA